MAGCALRGPVAACVAIETTRAARRQIACEFGRPRVELATRESEGSGAAGDVDHPCAWRLTIVGVVGACRPKLNVTECTAVAGRERARRSSSDALSRHRRRAARESLSGSKRRDIGRARPAPTARMRQPRSLRGRTRASTRETSKVRQGTPRRRRPLPRQQRSLRALVDRRGEGGPPPPPPPARQERAPRPRKDGSGLRDDVQDPLRGRRVRQDRPRRRCRAS